MYCKDPVKVLKEQLSKSLEDNIISPSTSGLGVCHPMNERVGKVCRRVQDVIDQSLDASVSWRNLRIDGEQSVVSALLVYSNKSQVSLTTDDFNSAKSLSRYFTFPKVAENPTSLLGGQSGLTYRRSSSGKKKRLMTENSFHRLAEKIYFRCLMKV